MDHVERRSIYAGTLLFGEHYLGETVAVCLDQHVEEHMNGVIYLVGLVVVVLAVLSFFGLR